jgi:hypothetical protein
MEIGWIDDTDGHAAAAALVGTHAAQLEAEATELALAAHWAKLHDEDSIPGAGRGARSPVPSGRADSAATERLTSRSSPQRSSAS